MKESSSASTLLSMQVHDDSLVHGLASTRRLSKANRCRPLSAGRTRLLTMKPLLEDINRELSNVRKQQEELRAESISTIQSKRLQEEVTVNNDPFGNKIKSFDSITRKTGRSSFHVPHSMTSLKPQSKFIQQHSIDPVTRLLTNANHSNDYGQVDAELFQKLNRDSRKTKRPITKSSTKSWNPNLLPPKPKHLVSNPPITPWHCFRGNLGPDRLLKSILRHNANVKNSEVSYEKHVRFSTSLTNDEPLVNPFVGTPGHTSLVVVEKMNEIGPAQNVKEEDLIDGNVPTDAAVTSDSLSESEHGSLSESETHYSIDGEKITKGIACIDTQDEYEIVIPKEREEKDVGGSLSSYGIAALSSLDSPALDALINHNAPIGHDETTIQALVEAGIFSGIGSTDDYTMCNNFTTNGTTQGSAIERANSTDAVEVDGIMSASFSSVASSSSTISGHSGSLLASRLKHALQIAKSSDEDD